MKRQPAQPKPPRRGRTTPEAVASWRDRRYPACWDWPHKLGVPRLAGEPLDVALYRQRRSLEQWQVGRCAICGLSAAQATFGRLVEDHDHDTGYVRGMLCSRCNTAEGSSRQPIFQMYRGCPPTVMLGLRISWDDIFSEEGALGHNIRNTWSQVVIDSEFRRGAGEFDEYGLGTLSETRIAPPEGARNWIYLLEQLADRLNHGEVGRMNLHMGVLWIALRDAMTAVEEHLDGRPPMWVPRRTIDPSSYFR